MLKRSLKRAMKSLGLHGLILRNETPMLTDTGYIATNKFETVIAFEAPVKDGVLLMYRLVIIIKDMCFSSKYPPMNYDCIEETLAVKPTIRGIAIAETNVQPQNHRPNSSGKVYHLSNPSTLEKVFTTIKSGYKEYGVPAMNLLNAFSRNTSS